MQAALSLGLVVAAGLTAMAGLAALRPLLAGHPEVLRKAMHVVTGLLALSFPWLFESAWQGLAAAAAGVLVLCAAKRWPYLRRRLGGVVDGVARQSHGAAPRGTGNRPRRWPGPLPSAWSPPRAFSRP